MSGDEENREICEILGRVVNGRLTEVWSKELLLETIQDFINENGYYPTIKEMDADPMLPAHASSYIAMGMGYTKVKETYFPDVVKKEDYFSVSRDEWMKKYKGLYKEMGMPPQRVFNNERAEGCVSIWVRRTGCKSWNDLLQKSGFVEAVRRDNNHHCELIVSISELNLSVEAYDKMEETLKKILVKMYKIVMEQHISSDGYGHELHNIKS